MIEFLIRPTEVDWFTFPPGTDPFQPFSMPFQQIEGPGDARIEIDGCPISFSYEDPGIQVSFEGQIQEARAVAIAEEIRQRIEQTSGQTAQMLQISA